MAGFPREYLETSCGGSLKTASPQLYGQICAMREQPDNPGRGEAEFRYQRADGTELWLYLNGGLAELEGERRLECLFLDVTELVVARTRLENITNTIPGGVVQLSFGEDWRILYANDGFYRLNGYTRQEYRALAGDLFIRLMHPDDEAVFETAVREMIGTRQTGGGGLPRPPEGRELALEGRLRKDDRQHRGGRAGHPVRDPGQRGKTAARAKARAGKRALPGGGADVRRGAVGV